MIAPGDVWLVGAGPGDPDLLTRKAERLIQAATVIFVDALVGPGVIALIPPHVRQVSVGKRSGRHSKAQESINDLIVADFKGSPVRVRDVAAVVDGEEEPRTLSRLNGENAVSLLIRKQSGTNTVAVVDAVKARLAEIQKGLPQDIKFQLVRDLSRFIKRSFHEVQDHLLLGGLLYPRFDFGCRQGVEPMAHASGREQVGQPLGGADDLVEAGRQENFVEFVRRKKATLA